MELRLNTRTNDMCKRVLDLVLFIFLCVAPVTEIPWLLISFCKEGWIWMMWQLLEIIINSLCIHS